MVSAGIAISDTWWGNEKLRVALEQKRASFKEWIKDESAISKSSYIVYLTCGNDNLSLGRLRDGRRSGTQYLDHFGFVVDSKEELQQWYEYLQAQGVELLDAPHDHSDGGGVRGRSGKQEDQGGPGR